VSICFLVHYHAFFLSAARHHLLDRLAVALSSGGWPGSGAGGHGRSRAVRAYYLPRDASRNGQAVGSRSQNFTARLGYLFFMTLTVLGLLFYTALTL
jgi:hypothetical protein